MTRLAVCLTAVLSVARLTAQTGAGRVQGTVADSTHAIVPGAKIAAEQTATSVRQETLSNASGFFIFPALQPGPYRITVEAQGMEKWATDIELQTGQEIALQPMLTVGSTSTQVTVTSEAGALVNTTSATLANTLERQRLEELPLNGRFFQNLLTQTTPGLEGGLGGTSAPQPFGLRDGTVAFVQDGVAITDANLSSLMTRPPGMDSIQEYRVEMSVPSARYSNAVTTVLSTRSGTNQFHGGLFYTGRNNGFGIARQRQDFYTKPPQLIRNEYGASIGGPVMIPRFYNGKDRTFFFSSWEAYALRSGATINTAVPTPAMEQGDFSKLTDAQSRSITLYDPWSTGNKANNYSRTPFAGNIIPLSRRSPLAAYYYSVMPQATQPDVNPAVADNWYGPDPSRQNDWTHTDRVDHRIGNNDQIYGRFTAGHRTLLNRRPNQPAPITTDYLWNSQDTVEDNYNGSLTWNHVLTPALFVESLLTGARLNWRFDLLEPTANQNLSPKLGVPNPFNIPGAPNITSYGYSLQAIGVIPRFDDTKPFTGEQNWSWVRGTHQMEFGWRFERLLLDVLPDRPGEGAITFNSQATGLYDPSTGTAYNSFPRTGEDVANFYIGVAGSYAQTLPAPEYFIRSNMASGYFQDNWHITRDLTVNLGMRYDFMQPLLDSNGANAVFDFKNHALARIVTNDDLIRQGATTQAFVNSYTAIGVKFETTGQAGLPDRLVNLSKLNFSPRLGFAWHRKLLGKSVVLRGGYGQYRFPLSTRLFNAQRGNPPLQGTVSYNINSSAQSPDGLANYGLRSIPSVIAGTPSAANAISPNAVSAVPRGVSINAFAPSLDLSEAREWNLTLETEIMRNTLLRVAYVGTAGRHLDQDVQQNGQPNNYVYYVTTGNPLPTGAFAPVALRDYDQTTYGLIHVYSTTAISNFSGLQVEVQRRFSQGLGLQWYYVLSNAMWDGAGSQIITSSSMVPDPVTYFPGAVPTDPGKLDRFLNYARDPNIPHHRINWNFLVDLPFGAGKKFFGHANRLVNSIAGGWQLAASSSMNSRYFALPTANWGTFNPVQVYGKQYPVQDCRSGTCIRGYLYYNGYIPANQINTPNGVMGVPSNYRASNQPIWPIPATPNPSDPNASLYGTNLVFVPLKNGTQQRIAYDNGLHPYRNQYLAGPWIFVMNSSLFKVIPLGDRFRLRLNMDFFNVLNNPGTPSPDSNTGIISLRNSANGPRQLQWTLRLNW